ncbi:MAG TPA: hypothetical protein VGM56_03445 [Byssovorax sp.]|jgi:hypothetical protein
MIGETTCSRAPSGDAPPSGRSDGAEGGVDRVFTAPTRGRRAFVAALIAMAPMTRAVIAGAALALVACDGGAARAPNPTRPLDERRAVEVIRRTLQEDGVHASPSREEKLQPSGKIIRVDVGVQGRSYGIAYITTDDAHDLGEAIQPPNKKDERLRIVRAGADGETRVVLLYQDNYLYDDLAGDSHEQTTIAVEAQIKRDVLDFLTHARSQNYP